MRCCCIAPSCPTCTHNCIGEGHCSIKANQAPRYYLSCRLCLWALTLLRLLNLATICDPVSYKSLFWNVSRFYQRAVFREVVIRTSWSSWCNCLAGIRCLWVFLVFLLCRFTFPYLSLQKENRIKIMFVC